MTIKFAILGLLSWQPYSGYDLKKVIADSFTFYWSGNNNQIYTTLVELNKNGLVTTEVVGGESTHIKKIYTITKKGRAELKDWVLSTPQPPETRNSFLIQLAWADQLSDQELDNLLGQYEDEVQSALFIQQERVRRGIPSPERTGRESYLWRMISENLIASYSRELGWVQELRKNLPSKKVTP